MNSTIKVQSRREKEPPPPKPWVDIGEGKHPRLDVNKAQQRLHDDLQRLIGKKVD